MTDLPNDREMLATAYLLGQATEEQAREFKALEARDPEFRALVRELEAWLAPLGAAAPEREPPPGLLDDVFEEIDAEARPSSAADAHAASSPGGWRPAAIASSLVAAVAVGLHLVPASPALRDARELVALMSAEDAPGAIVFVYRPDTGELVARMSNLDLPEEGVLQLWLIRDGEAGPTSLGLLDRFTGTDQLTISLQSSLSPGTDTLAVSLEPAGGSPEPGPTGPILFASSVNEI